MKIIRSFIANWILNLLLCEFVEWAECFDLLIFVCRHLLVLQDARKKKMKPKSRKRNKDFNCDQLRSFIIYRLDIVNERGDDEFCLHWQLIIIMLGSKT